MILCHLHVFGSSSVLHLNCVKFPKLFPAEVVCGTVSFYTTLPVEHTCPVSKKTNIPEVSLSARGKKIVRTNLWEGAQTSLFTCSKGRVPSWVWRSGSKKHVKARCRYTMAANIKFCVTCKCQSASVSLHYWRGRAYNSDL